MHLTLCGHGQANLEETGSFFVVGFLWRMLWDWILMSQGCCVLLSATLLLHLSSLALIPFFLRGISSSPFFSCLPDNLFNINGVLTVLYSKWRKLVSSGLQIACARMSDVYYTFQKYIIGKE